MTQAAPIRVFRVAMRGAVDRLNRPIDGASLAFFRVAFGSSMVCELARYFWYGRIDRYFLEPKLLFPYYGFEWLGPLPARAMYMLYGLLLLAAACVALGLYYRLASATLFVGYTYTFLLDQTNYQNHLYLFCLLSGMLVFIDAHAVCSVDSRTRALSAYVPTWHTGLIGFQLTVVYVYGGINKLTADWISGVPMALQLEHWLLQPDVPDVLLQEDCMRVMAWSGIAIDLAAVPLLLWKRTRSACFLALAAFHLSNSRLFEIGVFPWAMLASSTIFFAPSWPRRLFRNRGSMPAPACAKKLGGGGIACLALYAAVQLLVPLRVHLYPGDPVWSMDGQYFSWSMKLHTRQGVARLLATDAQGHTKEVLLRKLVSDRQLARLAYTPDMVFALTRYVAEHLPQEKPRRLRWVSYMSLDGRALQPYVMADAEHLLSQHSSLGPTRIVLPMRERSLPSLTDVLGRMRVAKRTLLVAALRPAP